MHYLLAAKSWSPVQYLTRMSHEELNPYQYVFPKLSLRHESPNLDYAKYPWSGQGLLTL